MTLSNLKPEPWLRAGVGVMVLCGLGFRFAAIYDLPTAITFALGLACLARGYWRAYMWIFLLGCVNRETTALLTLVFMIYFYKRMGWGVWLGGIALQAWMWLVVRVQIVMIFADSPGADFWFRPRENVEAFILQPWLGAFHWAGFGLVIWLCLRKWQRKPALLRTAFAVLMPVSVGLYLVLGNAFELRVFAEVFPVVWWLALGNDE
jgi:hypothetical protein